MRLCFFLIFCLFSCSIWCQDTGFENGFGIFDPSDRLVVCPDPVLPTAMPFLGFGSNCFMQSFNQIRVVAPELDAIINSDQNPALLHQPEPYHAVQLDYTPWQPNFSFANAYALKVSLQKQFRKGGSWDLRYENFSVAPSFGISQNNSIDFEPRMQLVRLAYAKSISKHWSLGIATKYASQKPADDLFFIQTIKKTNTLAADLGFKYQNSKTWSDWHKLSWQWGFSLGNVGQKVESEITDDLRRPLPTTLSAGFLLEQELLLQNTASLRIRGAYQINKLLVPSFCQACDDDLNGIDDYLEYSAAGGMLASFTDAPGGFQEELQEINHQFDMGATYKFNGQFGLRTQFSLFYQHPDKGGIQYLASQLGLQWGKIQLDLVYYSPLYQADSGKLGLKLGYQHFLTSS